MLRYSENNYSLLRRIILAIFFSAIIYALSFVPALSLPFIPVPIIAQNMGVMLAASTLGPPGALSVIFLLLFAAAGFPVLTNGIGGISVFVAPSSGFLYGWIISAWLVGVLVRGSWRRLSFIKLCLINIMGVFVVYIPGIALLSIIAGMPLRDATAGSAAFIPLDITKAIIVSFIAMLFKRHYPLVVPRSSGRSSHYIQPVQNMSNSDYVPHAWDELEK